jgi:uncharacterized protein (TIGR02391 family)
VSENGKLLRMVGLAHQLTAELAEYALPVQAASANGPLLPPGDDLLDEYDRRILDQDLRTATRSRFASKHYADAVEAGVKALNECIRERTRRTEDGDGLMTLVFSPKKPLLRITKLRSKSYEDEQRGHMLLCQGVVAAWRNPRAHVLTDDQPVRCLMMLEMIGDLIETTKAAVRTRKHSLKP